MITNYRQVLRMVREVNSLHFKVCLDAPLMERKDPEYLRKAVHDVGSLQVQSHFGGEYEQKQPGGPIRVLSVKSRWRAEYERSGYTKEDIYRPFVQALIETGYDGFISYELCRPLPVVNGRLVGIEYAHENSQLAAEFMRGVIAEASKAAARS